MGATDRNCRLLPSARGPDSLGPVVPPDGRAVFEVVVFERDLMELLHERCAGLDIGKKDLKACVRTPGTKGRRSRRQEIRTFATTTNALLELRDWLVAERVSLVVMEATGDYVRHEGA